MNQPRICLRNWSAKAQRATNIPKSAMPQWVAVQALLVVHYTHFNVHYYVHTNYHSPYSSD